ncbi:MAG: YaiI/YqxD family protein [Methylococcales bacterium]|nr:YaiI/YqxD family protein [Methylococcales bacterium]
MKIWVDADACPVVIKEILFKASKRTKVITTLVANQFIQTPPISSIRFIQVGRGFDVADNEIVQRVEAGDLVITSDIPLAAEVIEKEAIGLSFRGELYTKNDIEARLTMRNFMDTLRSSGIDTGGQAPFSPHDRQTFANHLDKILAKNT